MGVDRRALAPERRQEFPNADANPIRHAVLQGAGTISGVVALSGVAALVDWLS